MLQTPLWYILIYSWTENLNLHPVRVGKKAKYTSSISALKISGKSRNLNKIIHNLESYTIN